MSHTHAPWSEPCNFGASRFEVQGDGRQVAVINTIDDARLIAAAPDLLAVVQELEESAAYWSEYEVPLGIVDRMRAAIAKAIGGAA